MKRNVVVLALVLCLLPSCFTVAHAASGYPLCVQNLLPENLLGFLDDHPNLALVNHDSRSGDITYVSWTSIEYLSDLVLDTQWGGSVAYNPDIDAYVVDVRYRPVTGVVSEAHGSLGTWDGYVFAAPASDSLDLTDVERLLEYIRRAAADMAINVSGITQQLDLMDEHFCLHLEQLNLNLESIDTRFELAQIYIEAINTNIGTIQTYLYDGYTDANGKVQIESIAQKLDRLIKAVNSLVAVGGGEVDFDTTPITDKLTSINNKLLATSGTTQYTIAELTRNLWNAQKDANTALSSLISHVDGLESSVSGIGDKLTNTNTALGTLNGYVDGVEGAISTTNSKLTTLTGYVDGVETTLSNVYTRLGTINSNILYKDGNGNVYTIAELLNFINQKGKTGNELLTSLNGYVDGLEAGVLSGNALTQNISSTAVKMDSTLSTMLQWLRVQTYGDQDIYGTMSNMVYSYYYGDAAKRATIQAVWDKYWLEDEAALAAKMTVRINADQLREMQRQFNEIGIPTIIEYDDAGGRYVLSSQGNARLVDIDDFSNTTTLITALNTYPRIFTNAGVLYYSTEDTTSSGVADLNGKLTTVIDRLDTLIDGQDGNLSADVTVDLGEITLVTDDTVLAKYLRMIAYGQQDMYSILATISAEYKTVTEAERAKMDKILLNYWKSLGSQNDIYTITGDHLQEIYRNLWEIGYPCSIVKPSGKDYYVIQITGWPRVSDVFDYDDTGRFADPDEHPFYEGQVYYFTQNGMLFRAYDLGSESLLEEMSAHLESLVAGQAAVLDGVTDGINSHSSAMLDALADIESVLSNLGDDFDIENNTNIDISEDNDAYNVFFVNDPDGGDDQSIVDLSGDALTAFGKLLDFLYQVGFKDALDGAGPGIGDLADFYLDDAEGSADLWAS